jgi:hypothetical protein
LRPFILFFLLCLGSSYTPAQSLDTLNTLITSGRVIDAKIYIEGITDSTVVNSYQYQVCKGKLYQELFKQSLLLFGIKNNNWLATSCNAYVDGITAMATKTRVPDSLFVLIADCYEHSVQEALIEDSIGSKALAHDLYYAGHYSAKLWSMLSGLTLKDADVQYHLGMFFYRQALQSTLTVERTSNFERARYYLLPLVASRREGVLDALNIISEQLK